ncbi:ShlB/FhaC/HecB family hemolysin secretion/activation protein [Stenomitos frigidus]|uniref:ShlB/FhaC/HecB family hemolysin secretion/activation protein n=1 Tax=Stenomitos frigidus ULC18 TaxID=2107698 RepID=A0A2T1E9F9_9CYAN|nr:ShlB/FhaC/HecB family hemolysin secretion/activation protein [Stenomitos frigidus]PSB29389.1 ShlB/FhaC/HecB family hemolysin secretion/activation protein [Stenomitos frigidus ULC18]
MQRRVFGFECGVSIAGVIVWLLPVKVLAATPINDAIVVLPAPTVTLVAQVPNPGQNPPAQLPDPSQLAPDPNRDRLIQPVPTPTPPTPDQQPVLPSTPTPPQDNPSTQPSPKIAITKIEVTGSTILGAKDLTPITQPLEGQTVTLEQLRQTADAITQLYLDRGYITSRAILADQTVANGVVQIRVVEGSLERIDIEGTQRLKPSYVRNRIQLGANPPLSRDKLEDQLRLLKADPLFTNVEASLRPGAQLGQSILVVRVTEAKAIDGLLQTDNYSPPSVGAVRLGGALSYRNLTAIGDQLSASYFGTTRGGSDAFDFNYIAPINAMNGTVQLRIAPSKNRIIDPAFKALDIRGKTTLYELSYRQPLIRTPREELALSVGFAIQDGQTFLFNDLGFPFGIGPDADGNSKTRVLKFGQDYVSRDPQGAWALRSQFNFGLGILNATENDAPIPDGRFFSWLAQAQRVQRLGNSNLLIAQLDVQLTPDSLLPSQQFVIGGGQSLRGYRQNARSGDNGFRFSVEDRVTLARDEAGLPTFQLAPFFDMGTIWNQSDNPNPLPSQKFLAAIGLGLLWQPLPRLNLRLDYAIPFVDLSDRGTDAQDQGFYFSLSYQF